MPHKQPFFAAAAGGRTAQLVRANAVGGVAVRADDVQGFSHLKQLEACVGYFKPGRAGETSTKAQMVKMLSQELTFSENVNIELNIWAFAFPCGLTIRKKPQKASFFDIKTAAGQ